MRVMIKLQMGQCPHHAPAASPAMPHGLLRPPCQIPRRPCRAAQSHRAGSRPLPLWAPPSNRSRTHILKANNQLDGWVSPSQMLEEQMQLMNNMDRIMDQVDRDMERAMRQTQLDMKRFQQQLEQQQRELITDGQSVKIERGEERTLSSFRSYQSVQVVIGGPTGYSYAPTPTPSFFSPALVAAAILVGVYTAVTAAFFKNFDLTVYKDQGRWVLAPLWPVLLVFNARFRNQFLSAIRGVKPNLDDPPVA